MKASWNGQVLAQSKETVVVEGNHYFPPEAIRRVFFSESSSHTTCPWKGQASYYHIEVDGAQNANAAWYYPKPKPAAAHIKNHVAFGPGIEVQED